MLFWKPNNHRILKGFLKDIRTQLSQDLESRILLPNLAWLQTLEQVFGNIEELLHHPKCYAFTLSYKDKSIKMVVSEKKCHYFQKAVSKELKKIRKLKDKYIAEKARIEKNIRITPYRAYLGISKPFYQQTAIVLYKMAEGYQEIHLRLGEEDNVYAAVSNCIFPEEELLPRKIALKYQDNLVEEPDSRKPIYLVECNLKVDLETLIYLSAQRFKEL